MFLVPDNRYFFSTTGELILILVPWLPIRLPLYCPYDQSTHRADGQICRAAISLGHFEFRPGL